MTDFNKIRYRAVTEFLTLENVPPQQIHNRMTVVYGECAAVHHHMPRSSAGQQSYVKAEAALKMSPGRDVRLKLSVKKTVVLLKILYCKIVESIADS